MRGPGSGRHPPRIRAAARPRRSARPGPGDLRRRPLRNHREGSIAASLGSVATGRLTVRVGWLALRAGRLTVCVGWLALRAGRLTVRVGRLTGVVGPVPWG